MVLPTPALRRTMSLWTQSRYLKVTVKISMETSMKSSQQQNLAVNVWCKNFQENIRQFCKLHFSYTCKKFENLKGVSLLMWNTSVSDHCCHHCDGVVYKADAVMDTIHHKDECQTMETSVCRILPGSCAKLLDTILFNNMLAWRSWPSQRGNWIFI